MGFRRFGWLAVVVAFLALPAMASAQNATLTGIVRDNTGGVLPGVTVTATNEASGTTFVGVSDGTGAYRVIVVPGTFRITAELSGFGTAARPGVELRVGQSVALNLELGVSSLQETVTVTGEAPLLDTSTSTIGTNIDPRQMQDLPLNGRNWMDLTLLSAGSRSNASGEVPQDRQGFFQVNVDGQSVTLTVCCAQNQPRYSRDAIAEFEVTTNRFDATQGRTMGMMVNAITKSGTNTLAGTLSGYFRDDSMNAGDFIQKNSDGSRRVIPYQNQQIVGTFGGPIVKDKAHYFLNWEYEREPNTVTFNSRYPSFNIDMPGTRTENKGAVKFDYQFDAANRMSMRFNRYENSIPNSGGGGASLHPSAIVENNRKAYQFFGDYTKVISNNSINQLKGGVIQNFFTLEPVAGDSRTSTRRIAFAPGIFEGIAGDGATSGREILGGTQRFDFAGYSIGSATNTPQRTGEKNWQIRDDFTTSYNLGGRHDVKFGGEFIRYSMPQSWCNICSGRFTSNAAPPANIEQLIPNAFDSATWNVNALSPLIRDFTVSVGSFNWNLKREIGAAWYQDDWKIGNKFTMNLGIRYDVDHNVRGEGIQFDPWFSGKRPTDKNNLAPRLGFAYQASDNLVFRGGYGLFFTQLENDGLHQTYLLTQHMGITIPYDGRPDFVSNPFNGPVPTYEQALARSCTATRNAPGCYQRSITIEVPFGEHQTSYSHMGSGGFQYQFGGVMSYETNFVFTGGRAEERRSNVNLSYNPATGANYPFTDVSRRPFPDWSLVLAEIMTGRSNYYGWENTFTKRFSDRWQANATYTYSKFYDDGGIGGPAGPFNVVVTPGAPIPTQLVPLGFDVAADLRPDYQLAENDQRHRATFNGIFEMGAGFQLSGVYLYGSGQRFTTNFGGDRRNVGTGGTGRLRADGTIAPRTGLVGEPIHRVDLRLSKRQKLVGKATIDGMFEIFNLFNHENYGSYTTAESNANYGRPVYNANIAFQPRIVQLGFRLAF